MFKRIISWLKAILAAKPEVAPAPEPAPTPQPAPPSGEDFDLRTISWLGTPVTNATVTAMIEAARINNDRLYTVYAPYSWPSNGAAVKPCDAICYLFYELGGKITGGKFDWWTVGGQPIKGLENVRTGYHGHTMPAHGVPCWTMISSIDLKQRSNICRVTWA